MFQCKFSTRPQWSGFRFGPRQHSVTFLIEHHDLKDTLCVNKGVKCWWKVTQSVVCWKCSAITRFTPWLLEGTISGWIKYSNGVRQATSNMIGIGGQLYMDKVSVRNPVTSYGDIDLGKHWRRWWFVPWPAHKPITGINVDYNQPSVRTWAFHPFIYECENYWFKIDSTPPATPTPL